MTKTTRQNSYLIEIDRLAVDSSIGVYPHEKNIKQRLYISLKLAVDFGHAMATDALSDTLDYAQLSQTIITAIQQQHFELIERIVGIIENILIEQYQLKHYHITVSKPSALAEAQHVSAVLDKLSYTPTN